MKKRILGLILILLLGLCGTALWFFFFYQPRAVVTDETQGENSGGTESGSGENKENQGVLNKNVHIYTGEDAENVNGAIISVEFGNDGLILRFADDMESGPATLGKGDIFWLEGNESTPLEATYIGKVVSNITQGEECIVTVESPMIDEVFDELYLDGEFELNADNVENMTMVDGVSITPVNSIPQDFLEADAGENEQTINMALNTNTPQVKDMNTASLNVGNFVIEIDADLTELLNIKDSEESKAEKEEDSIASADEKCKVKGKIGLEDLHVNFTADLNKNSYGLKELSAGVSGRQVFSTSLEFSVSGEVSGKTTEEEVLSFVKLQGLKQKVFPIAYLECKSNVPIRIPGFGNSLNKNIEEQHEFMPFSCGFMVYIDIYGNLSLKIAESYQYANEFDNKLVLVRDNKIVNSFESSADEPEVEYRVGIEASADADVHIGTSALLYLFNVNILDVGIAKAGGEIQGNGSFEASSDVESDSGLNASFYARLYVKVLDIKAAIKAQANLWGLKVSRGFKWEGTLLDLTILETGQKKDTHFDKASMSWSKITAEDADSFYYKGTNGKLIRENKDIISRKVLYEGEFFSICGLDQSYIYVLKPVEDEKYNVVRISKDGTVTKTILEDVKYILCMKEDVFYYVPSFSENQIYKIDRFSLKEEKYAEFDDNVELMAEEEDGFLVTVQEENPFSWLFGPECKYYRLAGDGQIIEIYEDNLTPQQCLKDNRETYYAAFEMISNGYLRETARKGYWLSKDEQTYVETEGVSGWHPTAKGIFTEQAAEDGHYDVVLYQNSDGSSKIITDVNSANAFFTFVQDKDGNWYYMDQTDTDLELYRLNSSFEDKKKIDTISLEEIPCDMENCMMELVNNRIFFYTMPSWSESEVLYRYNLY